MGHHRAAPRATNRVAEDRRQRRGRSLRDRRAASPLRQHAHPSGARASAVVETGCAGGNGDLLWLLRQSFYCERLVMPS